MAYGQVDMRDIAFQKNRVILSQQRRLIRRLWLLSGFWFLMTAWLLIVLFLR